MRKKLWAVLGTGAALFSVYIYLLVDSPGTSKEATNLARDAAMNFLLYTNKNTIPISGDKSLVEGCVKPSLETIYVLSEKGRFEFRVLCANKETAFILVAMRRAPPDYMGISKTSIFAVKK